MTFGKIVRAAGFAAITALGVSATFPSVALASNNDNEPVAGVGPIALCADAIHYVTVSPDNNVEIRKRMDWASQPAEIVLSGHKSRILALTITVDGKYIATADADRMIDIWSVDSGKIVSQLHESKVSRDYVSKSAVSHVSSLAFNPLGTDLVLVDDGYNTICRFHGSEPAQFAFEDAFYTTAPLTSVASDAHGGWVAGDTGGALHFFNASMTQIGATTSKMASSVRALAVSPDGAYLATGGDDNEVKVWNLGSAESAARRAANFALAQRYPIGVPVTTLAFRGDWKTILYSDANRKLNEWTYVDTVANQATTNLIAEAAAVTPVSPATVPETSQKAPIVIVALPPTATAANTSIAANTTKAVHRAWTPAPNAAAPVASATSLNMAAPPPRAAREVVRTGTASSLAMPAPHHMQLTVKQVSRLVGHSDYVNDVAFSPNGRTLASASRDHTVRLWNIADGTQETILGKHEAYVSTIAFSPNGQTLASGGWDDRIKLFDVPSMSENATDQRLPKQGSYVLSLDFSPDGSHFVSGGNDRTARLFNRATGAFRASALLPDGVSSVSYSPDGTRIAGGCLDGSVYLWDAGSMRPLHTFRPTSGARPVYCIAFLDNNTIAAGGKGGSLNVWSARTGLLATLPAGGQDVFALAFDGPRQLLAAGGVDKLIRFWSAESLHQAKNGAHVAPLLTLPGHASTVRSLAFNGDGSLLASGGWDYNILVWSVTEKPGLAVTDSDASGAAIGLAAR